MVNILTKNYWIKSWRLNISLNQCEKLIMEKIKIKIKIKVKIKDVVQQSLEKEGQRAIRYQETMEALEDVKAGRLIDWDDVLNWMEACESN